MFVLYNHTLVDMNAYWNLIRNRYNFSYLIMYYDN